MEEHVVGSGLTEQQLALASWWVRHGLSLRNTGYLLLIVWSASVWAFVLWTVFDTYVISAPREAAIGAHIAKNQLDATALQALAPQSIQTSDVSVFGTTGNRQDFLVQVSNPNAAWWADFTYQFAVGGETTPARKGFILPGSQRYLTELGWKGQSAASSAQLQISNLMWHHLNPQLVGNDYGQFQNTRLQLAFKDVKYATNLVVGNQTIGRTSFTLANPSGYGFWGVDVTAVLLRGATPVGVNTITVPSVKPDEQRQIVINWFDNLPGVTKTDLQANVNILDPDAYLPSGQF